MKTTIMLQEKAGYNLPLANSIKLMRRQLRGDLAGDAYVIAHYGARGTRTILKEG